MRKQPQVADDARQGWYDHSIIQWEQITFVAKEHTEDAIACITSTAEEIASCTFWTSAWTC